MFPIPTSFSEAPKIPVLIENSVSVNSMQNYHISQPQAEKIQDTMTEKNTWNLPFKSATLRKTKDIFENYIPSSQ